MDKKTDWQRKLQAQAQVVTKAAHDEPDDHQKTQLRAAADTLDRLANRYRKDEPILWLQDDATDKEISAARQKQSVRCGEDVFLPSCAEAAIVMPNALLRSALFAATNTNHGQVSDIKISAYGDVRLILTGEALRDYDRKIFAACLSYYRGLTPLSCDTNPAWQDTTFYKFAEMLESGYGPNVYQAICSSLMRLNAASLRVRIDKRSIHLPQLVTVKLSESSKDKEVPQGSDRISFYVSESMANLFAPKRWTAVPKRALNHYLGLVAWLVAFYRTHGQPYPILIASLYTLSGVNCSNGEFRRKLRNALEKLQGDDVQQEFKVEKFVLTKDKAWVCLSRWEYKGECPLEKEEEAA